MLGMLTYLGHGQVPSAYTRILAAGFKQLAIRSSHPFRYVCAALGFILVGTLHVIARWVNRLGWTGPQRLHGCKAQALRTHYYGGVFAASKTHLTLVVIRHTVTAALVSNIVGTIQVFAEGAESKTHGLFWRKLLALGACSIRIFRNFGFRVASCRQRGPTHTRYRTSIHHCRTRGVLLSYTACAHTEDLCSIR